MATVVLMGRRAYGSGSIYQRKDGMWIGTKENGWTEDGRRDRIVVSAKTEGECKRKLRDRVAAIQAGASSEVSTRVTVKEWSEDYLPLAETRLRPKAYDTSKAAMRWIISTIGHKRLSALTPADVRAVNLALRNAGRSEATRLRYHGVLMVMLKAAQEEGHAIPARVLATKPPVAGRSDREALTTEEAIAALRVAGTIHHGTRYLAAFLQGLRQAECLGLTWERVDLERGLITIDWQLQALPYKVKRDRSSGFRIPDGYEVRQLDGGLHLVRPKSKDGWRVIPIIPEMKAALEAWRVTQQELTPLNPHGLVWPNLDGRPTRAVIDDREWAALQDAAGIRHPSGRLYGIHEVRHTTATLLLELGVDPAVITAIMGHSDIVVTRGYQHARTGLLAEALSGVAAKLQLGTPSAAPQQAG